MTPSGDQADSDGRKGLFVTTHWTVALAAGREDSPQAAQALEKLCRTYWYPIYAFVRRQGHNPPTPKT
jgi:RNA polymerase sigma-70 factor (ECF subfamily)